MTNYIEYLQNLERVSKKFEYNDFYLWPSTQIGNDHQDIIARKDRVGVSDYEVNNKKSRPALIIQQIERLTSSSLLNNDFSILDIGCGDSIVLWQIKRRFPNAYCFGIDCNIDKFSTHAMVKRDGIFLFKFFMQHLFKTHSDVSFDLVLMLNSYRGWESAGLKAHEHDLPQQADDWFSRNSKYTILTATRLQILHLEQLGFTIQKLGKGEENSIMICLSKFRLPQVPFRLRVKNLLV